VSSDLSFLIRHSGREDARGPVRNAANLRQSLRAVIIDVVVKKYQ
jgi:hypothetical protein